MAKKTVLEVLAENVEALRKLPDMPSSQAGIAKASDVDQKTVGRLLNKTNNPGVHVLDGLAKAFKVEAWQLLVPAMDASRARRLIQISPAGLEVAELFDALPPHRRRLLYAHVQDMHNPEPPEKGFSETATQPAS